MISPRALMVLFMDYPPPPSLWCEVMLWLRQRSIHPAHVWIFPSAALKQRVGSAADATRGMWRRLFSQQL